ncbi:MAG: carbonic anhydrase, partial [Sphingomonadales bacterium]|nr:carbonic anhydrase [Sphingomonadales bacterium]
MGSLDTLIDGYRRFRETGWARERERWSDLAEGQSPEVMVIACSDSRVDPATIFDTRPGEMFVVRNVAALVPPYQPDSNYHGVSAALEFAVTQLEVKEVLVMGHGFCGGCAASLTGQFDAARDGEGHFIAHWIDLLDPARDRVLAEHGGATLDRAAFQAMEMEG